MTEDYKIKLVRLAKELMEYRQTADCKDITFLSKLDYLIGYIMAFEGEDKTKPEKIVDQVDPKSPGIGHMSDRRCPQCGATLLVNDWGDEWCSLIGDCHYNVNVPENCTCHCHKEKDLPPGVQCKCIKSCPHCFPTEEESR